MDDPHVAALLPLTELVAFVPSEPARAGSEPRLFSPSEGAQTSLGAARREV
jgi:hypothetical protein